MDFHNQTGCDILRNNLIEYYRRKEEDYKVYIQPFFEKPLYDIEEKTLIKSREYIDGLIKCILNDKLTSSFPIDVVYILKKFGYKFYETDFVKSLIPLGDKTILVLGEGNNEKKIFLSSNPLYNEVKLLAVSACLGDYLISQAINMKVPFFTGGLINKEGILTVHDDGVKFLDELCYEFALKLLIPDVIYLRLDSIGKAAGINPKDSSETFAKIFEVRNIDFDNRVKLAEGHGILYGC